ncbi:MAG: RHS repeat-associated core domain-containing protein [Pyrinomonadaceae bacterium]
MANKSSGRGLFPKVLVAAVGLVVLFVLADYFLPSVGARRNSYDDRGRITGRTTAGGGIIRYEYNKAGLLTKVSRRALGGLTGLPYPGRTLVTFGYDPAGNRVSMKDRSGPTRYVYDDFNRLTTVTPADGKGVTYEYDPWNNVRVLRLPDGRVLNYRYDVGGGLTEVTDGEGGILYERDVQHNRLVRRLPGGITTLYDFSQDGRLTSIRHLRADSSLICGFSYVYDVEGRIAAAEEATPKGGSKTSYEYDLAGRLSKVTQSDGTAVTYEYDVVGNRVAQTDARGMTRYAYDGEGRLVKAGDATYSYDDFGNLVSKEEKGRRVTYEYDDEGRLVKVAGAKTVRYTYDGEGNRVRREAGGKVTGYVNDALAGASQVLAEYEKGRPVSYYLTARSRVGRRDPDGKAVYFLEDQLGSTRCVVDGAGKVLARYAYTPFGAPTLVEGSAQTDYLYAGEQWDEDSQLVYLRARYYDPQTGRFLSPDPVRGTPAAPESFNQYVYAANDPVNMTDPLGMQPGRRQQSAPTPPPPPILMPTPAIGQEFSVQRRYDTPHVSPTQSQSQIYTQPTSSYDPNRHRPIWIESRQRAMEDWAVDILSRNPQSFKGYSAAAFSAIDHAILNMSWAPLETPIRKLSDPDYTNGHPYRTLGAGLEFGWHATTMFAELKVPKGLFATFRQGVPLSERAGLYAVNETWAGSRVYLPFVDPVVHNSKTLKLPFNTGWNLFELGKKSKDLYQTVSDNPSARQFVSRTAEDAVRNNPVLDVLDPLGLRNKTNLFFPPPGGGGGGGGAGVPKVGGVYLDQAARVIGNLGAITGAAFDPQTGRVTLVGEKSATLPPMKPEYLAEAIRAVYAGGPHEPGMTIDPNPQNPQSPTMIVRFFGNTENTRIGSVMFEADRLLKGYSIGNDNVTRQPAPASVPGYASVTARVMQTGFKNDGLWSRFWIVPEPVTARVSDDGQTVMFDPVRMRVRTETMRMVGGKLVSAGGIRDEAAEEFAAHFTDHYDEFAGESPVYAELKQVTQAVAVAKWMKQQGVPVDWNFVRIYAGRPFNTPQTTPAAYAELQRTESLGNVVRTSGVKTFGGVEETVNLQRQSDAGAARLQQSLAGAQPPETQEKQSFTVRIDNKEHEAVALPAAGGRELGSYSTTANELADCLPLPSGMVGLPGLSRAYNSLHNEPTEFGYSWSLQLPRLEFETQADEQGRVHLLSVEGDEGTSVPVQKFVLTSQFGIGEQRFTRSFVDEGLKRIGFAPDDSASGYRGLYPEQDGNYRLLIDGGNQIVFDAKGRPRAMFWSGAKALYDYDASGDLIAVSYSEGDGPEAKVSFEVAEGRIKSASYSGRSVAYEYNASGDLSLARCGGQSLGYAYDDRHLLTEASYNDRLVLHNDYDSTGRLLKQRDAGGNELEQKVEQAAGGRIVTVREGGESLRQHYDSQFRLTSLEGEDGNRIQYAYDDGGNVTAVEQILSTGGKAKLEVLPGRGLSKVLDPRGVLTEYHYTQDGALSEVLVNNRRALSRRFDESGRLLEVLYEGGYAEQYAYDAEGRLQSYRRDTPAGAAAAESVTFTYGEGGELVGIGAPNADGTAVAPPDGVTAAAGPQTPTYHYDDAGRPVRVEGPDGSAVNYTYDSAGEVRKVEMSMGRWVGRVEFEGERPVFRQTLAGGQYHYGYTPDGLLSSVVGPYGEQSLYFYDGRKRLQRIKLPDGRCLEYAYDGTSGRIAEERHGRCAS